MNQKLPGLVITGASGFIGRHVIEAAKGKFRLFCLARRSQKEAGIPEYDNLRWTQVDVSRWETMREVVRCIKDHGGADFVLHLAGYYDFSNRPNPEYERTNVTGTRHALKLAKQLGIRRFLFASSLAGCKFKGTSEPVTEETPLNADFPYAVSKRKGEEMLKEYTEWFPCTTIRFAAVYSDWCEYPPLYMFLSTWLGSKWNARILGGKGNSAITYLHIQDLIKLFFRIFQISDSLPRLSTCLASPNGTVSHLELYKTSTRYFMGHDTPPPVKLPKPVAALGILVRQYLGEWLSNPPFERRWMIEYIDKQLVVDASQTHKTLKWQPAPRLEIVRRLLFLIEKLKNHPDAWYLKNHAVLQRVAQRPNLLIYNALVDIREELCDNLVGYMTDPQNQQEFERLNKMDMDLLKWNMELVYQVLITTVRTRNRNLMLNYARVIAYHRFMEGFEFQEIGHCLSSIGTIISAALHSRPDMQELQDRIYDYVALTMQMAVDEAEDTFEYLSRRSPELQGQMSPHHLLKDSTDLERIVHDLEDICSDESHSRLDSELHRLGLNA